MNVATKYCKIKLELYSNISRSFSQQIMSDITEWLKTNKLSNWAELRCLTLEGEILSDKV